MVFATGTMVLLPMSGCLSSRNVRLPTFVPRSSEYERAEATVHDPFPRNDLGPDTSMRPLGFTEPRHEPRNVKEKTGLSGLRQQYGRPMVDPFPLGQQPGYFGAVP